MARYRNNKGKVLFSPKFLALCFILCAGIFLWWMLYPDRVSSGPYLDSAHGNTSYGVNRSSIASLGYSIANCTHCHEEHASIAGQTITPQGYELLANNFSGKTTKPYAQSDNVCFYCHIVMGTYQSPAFSNYTYSITFGGNPDTTPNNIFDTFNSTSYHNLYDIWSLITGLKGTKTFPSFPADSNPCSGCHNVHIAKRSCGKPTGSYDPTKSAISKPSDHNNLWGDDTSERLNSNFTTNYQAPYWYYIATPSGYEPANNSTCDGSNLPDYVSFCITCHTSTANSVWSTTLNRWLKPIDWGTTGGEAGGDKHGKNVATDTSAAGINLRNPYLGVWTAAWGLVLACTDCHEPHGAPNLMLGRKEVNGSVLEGAITSGQLMYYLCNRCHIALGSVALQFLHHNPPDAPYLGGMCPNCHNYSVNNCYNCHFHGGNDSWLSTIGQSPTYRRTF